jgi:replication factor C subunit 2/4
LACNTSSKIIEPIQSRCAILRYTRLSDEEITEAMMKVIEAEEVAYEEAGLAALLFVSEGDMRQALNNMQACHSGFGNISQENVFKVCDQPHPMVVKNMLASCVKGDFEAAEKEICGLWNCGYSAVDVVGTVFRVCKSFDDKQMPEATKLAFIREIGDVSPPSDAQLSHPKQC